MSDILTVFWKEWKELFELSGLRAGLTRLAIWILIFGIFLPLQAREEWLSSPMVLFYWVWFPIFVVSSLAAGSVAGERDRHTLETLLASRLPDRAILLGKVLAGVAYGWGLSLSSILLGLIAVNLALPGPLRLYSAAMGLGGPALSLAGAILAGVVGILVSLHAPTARQAQQTLSLVNIAVLFVPVFGVQILPAAWRARIAKTLVHVNLGQLAVMALAGLIVLDLLVYAWAKARFKRELLMDV